MLTATPFLWLLQELLQNKRVRKCEHHGDTDANQESRINQTSQQEHFGLKFVHQLGLTSSSLEVFAAHDADTDTSANRAHADDETRCQSDVTEDVFHLIAPMDDKKSEEKNLK